MSTIHVLLSFPVVSCSTLFSFISCIISQSFLASLFFILYITAAGYSTLFSFISCIISQSFLASFMLMLNNTAAGYEIYSPRSYLFLYQFHTCKNHTGEKMVIRQ